MAVAVSPATLSLTPPEYVSYGTQRVRCGGVVFRALKHLTTHQDTSIRAFTKAVWGENVQNQRLRCALWRVNTLLRGLGCPQVASLEGDRVLFG